MNYLILLLITIFTILAIFHFIWAIGIRWGEKSTLPTKENGEKVINPGRVDCIIAVVGLLLIAVFYLFYLDLNIYKFPAWIYKIGGWIIPSIFVLRAIGEFKYIGFFKKVKNTAFGKMDTQLFSPLCLFIGVIGVIIQIMK